MVQEREPASEPTDRTAGRNTLPADHSQRIIGRPGRLQSKYILQKRLFIIFIG